MTSHSARLLELARWYLKYDPNYSEEESNASIGGSDDDVWQDDLPMSSAGNVGDDDGDDDAGWDDDIAYGVQILFDYLIRTFFFRAKLNYTCSTSL